MPDQAHIVAFLVTLLTSAGAVALHYEAFIALGRLVGRSSIPHRRRILVMVFGLLFVHIIAIWGYGISAWWLVEMNGIGSLKGYESFAFPDYIYMSAVTYTTVGYGDIFPVGPVRFLYGTQALVGLVLITWSASFAFIEMQRNWNRPD
ncbi:potassium channel family protein [Pseudohongiella sp.]|uniref:Potassium channel domain-containing protein n=1 Tax=marine sediment metagenome TaxID=412755 RepID=A0A0F9Z1B5_9ZZZZ|nr:potassium channel family protein [Pseudohongiella sp.]HDZ08316.1 two pore domain potassium channel family protein [Pseudohongiella sp.]HEA62592.1 two pore domain potassium channel family protein [Pseudohongiella sp.]